MPIDNLNNETFKEIHERERTSRNKENRTGSQRFHIFEWSDTDFKMTMPIVFLETKD